MRIHHIVDGISILITNEERGFISKNDHDINLESLDEHDQWLAHNLVRKGIYSISKDKKNLTLINNAKHSI
jgi:hypothetical protein